MRSFALFLVLLTSFGLTAAFVPSFVPSVRATSAAARFLVRKQNNELQRQQGMFVPHSQMRRTFLSSSEPETEVDMMSDIEYTKGMPDKAEFAAYYKKTVSYGMEMSKKQVSRNRMKRTQPQIQQHPSFVVYSCFQYRCYRQNNDHHLARVVLVF